MTYSRQFLKLNRYLLGSHQNMFLPIWGLCYEFILKWQMIILMRKSVNYCLEKLLLHLK